MSIDFDKIWETMIANFSLGDRSFHGPPHWRNVERNGLRLARVNGADQTVIRLFAAFHDVQRENECCDPEHGRRAAELAISLQGDLFHLQDDQLEILLDALRFHNDGLTSSILTIGTCWDADRLDLPRVGIIPDPKLMSTSLGKQCAAYGDIAIE